MALSSPFIVHVEKTPEASVGDVMNEIRSWLDHRKIEPVLFRPVAMAEHSFGFEIAFNTDDAARRFERDSACSDRKAVERVARELIDQHGPDSLRIVRERAEIADDLRDELSGEAWREIAAAIEHLLRSDQALAIRV